MENKEVETTDKPVVFILQENKNLNFEAAKEHGHVEFVTFVEFSPHEDSKANVQIFSHIDLSIALWDPTKDFIVPCGHPVSLSLFIYKACLKAIIEEVPYINILRWDNKERAYFPYKLSVYGNKFFNN